MEWSNKNSYWWLTEKNVIFMDSEATKTVGWMISILSTIDVLLSVVLHMWSLATPCSSPQNGGKVFLNACITKKYLTLYITIFQIYRYRHGLRTHGEEIAFTAWPKINSHSQIFRYGQSIFCQSHRPKFSDFFDLCLHWVSVVRELNGEKKKTGLKTSYILRYSRSMFMYIV